MPFNVFLEAKEASQSIEIAMEQEQKYLTDREAIQQEYGRLQARLESVREQLFLWSSNI